MTRKTSKQLNSFFSIKYFRKQDEKMIASSFIFTPNWYDISIQKKALNKV